MSLETAARMAGEWWAARLQQGDKQQFAREVERRVLQALQEYGEVDLECDYDPWGILLEAVQAIGLECSGVLFSARGILPAKHHLKVSAHVLRPKEGYANWTTPLVVPPEEGPLCP